MTLRTRTGSRAGGSDGDMKSWVNHYVPDGTPVRWIDPDSNDGHDDGDVQLVIGAHDQLVIDMSRSTVLSMLAALHTALDLPALRTELGIPPTGER